MIKVRFGGLDAALTGGVDGRGGGDGPLVVLLHGFGAPPRDLVPLGSLLSAPAGTRFLFPAAPLALGDAAFDARAWWMIDWALRERIAAGEGLEALAERTPDGLAEARAAVAQLLDEAGPALGADPKATVLGGFSQGAMLALDLALRDPRPLGGLVLLSPTMIGAGTWRQRAATRAGLPVYMSHGRRDPVLPYFITERLRGLLADAGLEVTWTPFDGGHEVPGVVVAALSTFLKGRAGGA